jgi:hypothetical protein
MTVIQTWLDKLASSNGEPIEMKQNLALLAFDHMGLLGFSKNFASLSAGKGVRWLHLLDVVLGPIETLGGVIWPLLIAKNLKLSKKSVEFDQISIDMTEERLKVRFHRRVLPKQYLTKFRNRKMNQKWKIS